MFYVLIVITLKGIVTFQEFETQGTCEAAAAYIESTRRSFETTPSAKCMPK